MHLGDDTPSLSHGTCGGSMSDSTAGHGQGGVLVAYVFSGRLFPNDDAKTFYPMFQKKIDPRGYNWKVVSNGLKDDWFKEFKKLYTWPTEQETLIKKYWTKLARRRYSDLCSKVIKPCRYATKSEFIKEVDWLGWLEYWQNEKV